MTLPKSHNYDPKHVFDVMVIGSGIAGMAASLFAVNRKLSTVQAGSVGGTLFTSGLFDLISVYPVGEKKLWENPWDALDAMRRDGLRHPYNRISKEDIQVSFDEMISFLGASGMKLRFDQNRNLKVITSMGTIKYTYCVPESMWPGVEAYDTKAPCLIVDFNGLKEFSARQVVTTLKEEWPSMRSLRVTFPGMDCRDEVYAVHLAQALELSETREDLARLIKPELGDARFVGLPAVLGIKRTQTIIAHLGRLLGVPVFEIPMMPASVPGFRLKEIFDSELPQKGLLRLIDKRVMSVNRAENGNFLLNIGGNDESQIIQARSVILATGRFMGKGLLSDRQGIFEPLFNLPLHQPENRSAWHHERFLHPAGHPINSAGVDIDDGFRPVDAEGKPIYDNLFAAGTILAHQDWMRMKCGSGLAIATAYAAVNAFIENFMKRNTRESA
ncbi:MAG TPA: glycerol-3-phosphate dehydrogenase subunit GlpB [Spirochaetota bacterium]|jgi:glycerol-3-phosphate dehydrogenase subunit B|nr:glycerol-3-phosphate dehydrogenase subunit GlpB [Spirochaetota bacterium]HPV42571.1 glycerol-3-phosphate dehydrogenase subunit GlpB [Spirochaetota bacterium]